MTFTLKTSGYYYRQPRIAQLESLGFRFDHHHPGEFTVDDDRLPTIEIASLPALMAFIAQWAPIRGEEQRIILTLNPPTIELYDDYTE